MLRTVTLACCVCSLVFLAGCGGITITDEDGEKVTIGGDGNSLTVETKDGNAQFNNEGDKITFDSTQQDGGQAHFEAGEGAELPENFPTDVPVYEGANVVMAITNNRPDASTFMVTLSSSDDASTVTDYYVSQLKEEGWVIESEVRVAAENNADAGAMIMATKENRQCSANVAAGSGDDGETAIVLTVEETIESDD